MTQDHEDEDWAAYARRMRATLESPSALVSSWLADEATMAASWRAHASAFSVLANELRIAEQRLCLDQHDDHTLADVVDLWLDDETERPLADYRKELVLIVDVLRRAEQRGRYDLDPSIPLHALKIKANAVHAALYAAGSPSPSPAVDKAWMALIDLLTIELAKA